MMSVFVRSVFVKSVFVRYVFVGSVFVRDVFVGSVFVRCVFETLAVGLRDRDAGNALGGLNSLEALLHPSL